MNPNRVVLGLALLFAAMLTADLASKPDRPEPPKQQTPKPNIPDLAGETNWGTIVQTGRKISIDGHPTWYAQGEIRDDGKLLIIWTLRHSGRPGPGLYEIRKDGKDMVGEWGYSDDVTIEEDGSLKGSLSHDRIWRIEPAKE